MKTIIAGSRDLTDYGAITDAIELSQFDITEVVSGGCRGADTLGERWARESGIPVVQFEADWDLGKQAGPIRNAQMADYADAAIVVHTGGKGSLNMVREMQKRGKRCFARRVEL